MSHIRSAALRGFRAAVAELGGDADEVARHAGLAPEALDRDDLVVDEQAVATVFALAADRTRCPDLGLRIAARQDITMLGSLAVAIQHSATMRDALECTTRYLFVHSRSLTVAFEPAAPGSRKASALAYGPASGARQATDMGLGFVHRTLLYLAGGPYGLSGVELPYRPDADPAAHEAFYGAPVRVVEGDDLARLRVPRRLLDHELSGVNDNLRQLALAFLAEQAPDVARAEAAVTPRVRAVVRESLGTGRVETRTVADLLALHPRTLQRRLEAEGTTLGVIVDDVRRDTVERLLATTELPVAQIGRMVGFAEQSALSRAGQRWWGMSPRRRRRTSASPWQESKTSSDTVSRDDHQ